MSIAIVTDSNSGISQEEAKQLGISVIPTPYHIDGACFFEGVSLTQEEFFQHLARGADITTSQPAPGDVMACWDKLLNVYDEIVYIPISSSLSNTYESGAMFAKDYHGKVHVADNLRLSVTQRQAVFDAMALAETGLSGAEIQAKLEEMKHEARIYVIVDSLKFLQKGGRISGADAMLGTLLGIKPVLKIAGGKVVPIEKCRGRKAAKKKMLDLLCEDIDKKFSAALHAGKLRIMAAYSANPENISDAKEWKEEITACFPGHEVHMDPISLSVACHGGPGALAIACAVTV